MKRKKAFNIIIASLLCLGFILESPAVALADNSKDWQATFSIDNNLKGKYNVKIVMAPNDTKKYKGNIMKYKFHPSVTYIEQKSTATLLDQYTGSGPKKKKNN